MLNVLVKVFISLYLLNMLMDLVDTLHVGRYWSEVLCRTIMTYPGRPLGQGHRLRNFVLSFWLKFFKTWQWIKLILCMLLGIGLKFYAVPS